MRCAETPPALIWAPQLLSHLRLSNFQLNKGEISGRKLQGKVHAKVHATDP